MEIRIDTERDSKADIRKFIKFLQSLVDEEESRFSHNNYTSSFGASWNRKVERRISNYERSQEADKLQKYDYDSPSDYSSKEPGSNEDLFGIFDDSKPLKSESSNVSSSIKNSGSSTSSSLGSADFVDDDNDFDFEKKKMRNESKKPSNINIIPY